MIMLWVLLLSVFMPKMCPNIYVYMYTKPYSEVVAAGFFVLFGLVIEE